MTSPCASLRLYLDHVGDATVQHEQVRHTRDNAPPDASTRCSAGISRVVNAPPHHAMTQHLAGRRDLELRRMICLCSGCSTTGGLRASIAQLIYRRSERAGTPLSSRCIRTDDVAIGAAANDRFVSGRRLALARPLASDLSAAIARSRDGAAVTDADRQGGRGRPSFDHRRLGRTLDPNPTRGRRLSSFRSVEDLPPDGGPSYCMCLPRKEDDMDRRTFLQSSVALGGSLLLEHAARAAPAAPPA